MRPSRLTLDADGIFGHHQCGFQRVGLMVCTFLCLFDTKASSVYSGYNVVIEIGRLFKVCVHAACSEVRTSKLLSHIFPVEKGTIAVIYVLE